MWQWRWTKGVDDMFWGTESIIAGWGERRNGFCETERIPFSDSWWVCWYGLRFRRLEQGAGFCETERIPFLDGWWVRWRRFGVGWLERDVEFCETERIPFPDGWWVRWFRFGLGWLERRARFCETEPLPFLDGFWVADWVLRNRANRVGSSVCLCECGARAPPRNGFVLAKSIALPLLCGVGHCTPRRVRMALKAFGMIGNLRDVTDCGLDILARNL